MKENLRSDIVQIRLLKTCSFWTVYAGMLSTFAALKKKKKKGFSMIVIHFIIQYLIIFLSGKDKIIKRLFSIKARYFSFRNCRVFKGRLSVSSVVAKLI